DQDQDRVFFGATVRYADSAGKEHTVSIVGTDEVDPSRGRVSWVSPVARALIKAREGETVTLNTPAGGEQLEVVPIRYEGRPWAGQFARLGFGLAARLAKSPAL